MILGIVSGVSETVGDSRETADGVYETVIEETETVLGIPETVVKTIELTGRGTVVLFFLLLVVTVVADGDNVVVVFSDLVVSDGWTEDLGMGPKMTK